MNVKEKLLVSPLGVLRLFNCLNESELLDLKCLTLVPHILVHADSNVLDLNSTLCKYIWKCVRINNAPLF